MKMLQVIALSTALLAGVGAAHADPFSATGGFAALNAVVSADSATIETVNASAARSLMIDTDTASLHQRLMNNKALSATIAAQGYAISDIVGIDGTGNNVTLYVL